MKKLLVAGIAATAFLSAPALAGPPPAPMFNWSGFYIGANGGGMSFKETSPGGLLHNPVNAFNTDKKETGIAGIHGGFQGQWGNFVLGVEGAWTGNLSEKYGFANGNGTGATPPCGLGVGFRCEARINDILSVGPRIGYAMGQWMLYGTGGYAHASTETQHHDVGTPAPPVAHTSGHNDGWYYGGGFEMFVLQHLTLGVEYRHYDFSATHQNPQDGFANIDDKNVKFKADAVLARLTIK